MMTRLTMAEVPYPLPGHMTTEQYANHRKVSKGRISELLRSGRLNGCFSKTDSGRYSIHPGKADAELQKTQNFREQQKVLVIETRGKSGPKPANPYAPMELGNDEELDVSGLDPATVARIQKESGSAGVQLFTVSQAEAAHYKAKLAKIKYEELEKTLIPADKAKSQMYEMARAIRDSLIELPDRISAEFAAIRDERKISIRLDEEIRIALERVIKILEKYEAEEEAKIED